MEWRRTWAGALALALVAVVVPAWSGVTHAATGDAVGSVTFSKVCAFPLSVGIAFDGSNLWYSCYGSSPDLYRADPRTGQVTVSYSIAGGLGALAYDARRNTLWAGYGGGSGDPGNMYQGAIKPGDVYLIQLDSSSNALSATRAFNAVALARGDEPISGLAYDALDGTLYASPEGSMLVYHYRTDGTLLDTRVWAGQGQPNTPYPCSSTGLAIGGQTLVEASDGCSHLWAADKTTNALLFGFDTRPTDGVPLRDEGLTCDTTTFGEDVVWTIEAGAPMQARAFEIPPGTCGVGGEPALTATNLTYTGATSGDFDDPATLSASLTDSSGRAVVGAPVSFNLDSQTCTGTTDENGSASCSITPSDQAGSYTMTATYAGDSTHLATSASATFDVTREETAITSGPAIVLAAQHSAVTLAAMLTEDSTTPVAGRSVDLTLGSSSESQTCTGSTDSSGTARCTVSPVTVPPGPQTITDSFSGDGYYQPATSSQQALVYATLPSGSFVLGDRSAATGSTVTWWGAHWARDNALSAGPAPNAFKGFAGSTSSTPPSCGGSWDASPGASAAPPSEVPSYMAVAVTSQITKSGSAIEGNIARRVIVRTNAGYGPDPGQTGTGTVVAVLCQS